MSDQHGYGWVPQKADQRDYEFLPTVARQAVPAAFELPGVDLIPKIDQGQQGSCTGHGTAGIVMYDLWKQSADKALSPAVMSRAMIYYDARIPEGTTSSDSGATVRDAVASVINYGVCTEAEFPYSDQVYDVAPTPQDYTDAKKDSALAYTAVYWPHINQAIASGYPVVGGFTVYDSFESDQVALTGDVPIPAKSEAVLGGHCTWFFGFNSTYQEWTAPSGRRYPPRCKASRNSWRNADGSWWGNNGDFFMPLWFFDPTNGPQATDFWVIQRIGVAA